MITRKYKLKDDLPFEEKLFYALRKNGSKDRSKKVLLTKKYQTFQQEFVYQIYLNNKNTIDFNLNDPMPENEKANIDLPVEIKQELKNKSKDEKKKKSTRGRKSFLHSKK